MVRVHRALAAEIIREHAAEQPAPRVPPGSELFLIRGARHFVQLDEPEQVARLILAMPGRGVRRPDSGNKIGHRTRRAVSFGRADRQTTARSVLSLDPTADFRSRTAGVRRALARARWMTRVVLF
jgi:hypothetical protein